MSCKKVYIGSIPGHLNEATVVSYFRRFVPTATFALNRNATKETSNGGFGFLTVPTSMDVQAIISMSHFLDGRKLKCEEYLTGRELEAAKENLKMRRLFIRGLKRGITDKDLHAGFSKFGEVESAYVVKSYGTAKARAFGYVTYKDVRVAQMLLQRGVVMVKNTEIFVHPFVKFDAINEQAVPEFPKEESNQSTKFFQSNTEQQSLQLADSFEGSLPSGSHSPKFFSSSQQNHSESQLHRFASSGSASPTLDQNAGRYKYNLGSRNPGLAKMIRSMVSGSSSKDEQLPQTANLFEHGTKPTSRAFFTARNNDANHTPENILLNIRCPRGSFGAAISW